MNGTPSSPPELKPGVRLGGYTLERRVGQGGMAEVWRARRDGRAYAIKVLHAPFDADDEFKAMFRDEMSLVGSLVHPNIVRLIEALEEQGRLAQVMEWIDGVDLGVLEVQLERDGGRFPVPAAVTIVRGAARALEAAHGLIGPDGQPRHLIHRDVAPQNIMVGRDGAVKLLDFGVAKATRRLTRTDVGVIKGRVAYMAPEQARGLELTGRADVFALGVVFWETLAMQRLFPAGGTLMEVVHRPPPPRVDAMRPDVDRNIVDLVERMLHPDPARRASVRDVAEGLEGHAEPGFDFAAWCRAVLPGARRATAVLPPPETLEPVAAAEPWSSVERTVYDPRPPSLPDVAATDAALAAEPTGPDASGPTALVEPPADDRTWASPLAHAQRIRGEDVAPTESVAVADAAWLHAPIGAGRPQSFARTLDVAATGSLVVPRELTGPEEGAWSPRTASTPSRAVPTRAVSELQRSPRRRPSRTEIVLYGLVAVETAALAWSWWIAD